ncbi:hypothetical protein C0Q70_15554 [Pomacea canaliculata]|uniref:Uncharacterized protein n=1 Tax=Pomacea canaliculata TaxID=400727 RepID=A0A2T7NV84_POMCA|nr:hypothetical protein C0Q70_15554 [Pomacea canaliculata]
MTDDRLGRKVGFGSQHRSHAKTNHVCVRGGCISYFRNIVTRPKRYLMLCCTALGAPGPRHELCDAAFSPPSLQKSACP